MPEPCVCQHADLTVALDGLRGPLDGLAHAEVLVVGGEDLDNPAVGVVEAHEVADYVEQSLLGKHAVEHRLPRRGLGLGVVPVHGFPGHEAVLVRRDGAHPCLGHVTHDAEDVGDEHAGDLAHVLTELLVGVRRIRLLARW